MKADATEKGRTYSTDHLNLSGTVHESENDYVHEADNAAGHNSEWLLVHLIIVQMANNINKYKSIIHECNILTYILNHTKSEKSKYDHYSQILQS